MRLRALGFRARLFLGTLALFVALVALRWHGSSLALTAQVWAGNEAWQHYVLPKILGSSTNANGIDLGAYAMATPRIVRADEWALETPWALAQVSHQPRFPVVNTNVGKGQHMLILPWVPVLHPTLIARPLTWGYLLFGSQHGLAWAWWSQPLLCFVALFLLFEIVVPRRPWLALLGSFWFCASAYVVCWSVWPAYPTGLGALATVAGYRLCTEQRLGALIAWGVLLGVALVGFVMQFYPPWLVPLGHAFLWIFVGLVVRDRLLYSLRIEYRKRLIGLGLAVLLAIMLVATLIHSSGSAMSALANSAYPGQRRLTGGDTPLRQLFGAFYNYYTNERPPLGSNSSEAAGFFLFYPAVVVALVARPRLFKRLNAVSTALLGLGAFFIYFCCAGVPEWVARLTLMSHAQGYRAQIALGLVSIVLCIQLLAVTSREERSAAFWYTGAIVFLTMLGLAVVLGAEFQLHTAFFTVESWCPKEVRVVSLLVAVASFLLACGFSRVFAFTLTAALLATSAGFNPLSRGFPPPMRSELGRAVQQVLALESKRDEPSLWLSYTESGFPNLGIVLQVLGARSIEGAYFHPQLELFRELDPTGEKTALYNRYLQLWLAMKPLDESPVTLDQPHYLHLFLRGAPLHPTFARMNARYVLTTNNGFGVTEPPYTKLQSGANPPFAIWGIPAR